MGALPQPRSRLDPLAETFRYARGGSRDLPSALPLDPAPKRRPDHGTPASLWRLTPALVATLAFALVAGADAQLGDVGPQQNVDTAYTPVAKESERWDWVAGAQFVGGGPHSARVRAGSVTPFEVDLFDVAFAPVDYEEEPEFREPERGFAGGAVCRERFDPEDPGSVGGVRGCERVSALYEFSVDAEGEKQWAEVDLGESATSRGYIGAIAWLDSQRALAVGGSGCYPRREEPCPGGGPATPPNAGDPVAGKARAWLYQDWDGSGGSQWRELEDLPAEMRGLSAVSAEAKAICNEGTGKTAIVTEWGCAAAGGLRQIWHFRDGAFVTGWSGDGSAPKDVVHPEIFNFRVRDIRGTTAVTAGCCTQDPTRAAGGRTINFTAGNWNVGLSNPVTAVPLFYFGSYPLPYPVSPTDPGSSTNDAVRGEAQKGQRPVGGAWDQARGTYDTSRGNTAPTYDSHRRRYDTEDREVGDLYTTGDTCGPPQPDDSYVMNLLSLCRLGITQLPPPTLGQITGEPWPGTPPNPLPEEQPLDPLPQYPGAVSAAENAVDGEYREAFGSVYGVTSPYAPVGVNPYHAVNTRTQLQTPDSFYALYQPPPSTPTGPLPALATISSAGGPAPGAGEDEPASSGAGCCPALSSIRLVSAEETPVRKDKGEGVEAVGVLRSSGQGVVWGPSERDRLNEQALLGCKLPSSHTEALVFESGKCKPDADRFVADQASTRLFAMP